MSVEKIFRDSILNLITIYQNEGSNNGLLTAKALDKIRDKTPNLKKNPNDELSNIFDSYISKKDHILAQQIKEISNYLPWERSSMGGRIDEDLKKEFIQFVLLGPTGIFKSNDYEVGILMQMPNIDYPARKHPAEETFFIIGGQGYFSKNDEPEVLGQVGDYIHHPSMVSHANRTENHHIIWSWRWSGDISLESYYKYK